MLRTAPVSLRYLDGKTKKWLLSVAIFAFLSAISMDSALIMGSAGGAKAPLQGDAPYFADLAESLAVNHGYFLTRSPWPEQPNVGRSPLWPGILSIAFRFFPRAEEGVLVRFSDAVMHGMAAALMTLLAYQMAGTLFSSFFSSFILAIYPVAASLVQSGYSELAFLVVLILGITLLLEGGRASMTGAVLCGLSVLARSNYLTMPIFVCILLLAFRAPVLLSLDWRLVRTTLILCGLFCIFPLLWMLRNYSVTGIFPVLSAMEGETLYGGNNARTATDLSVWGYWIMPDEIPGEAMKRELAKNMGEMALNRYYHAKAMSFIRSNLLALPRLLLGKLIRGFVPVPWTPNIGSYVAFAGRFLLYVSFGWALISSPGRCRLYLILLSAMFLVILSTTLIYCGSYRFTFCLEPFLLPFIAGAFSERRKGKNKELRIGFAGENVLQS